MIGSRSGSRAARSARRPSSASLLAMPASAQSPGVRRIRPVHDRAAALLGRGRLVLEPEQPAQPARRARAPHRHPHDRPRGGRHARRRAAVQLPAALRHRPRDHPPVDVRPRRVCVPGSTRAGSSGSTTTTGSTSPSGDGGAPLSGQRPDPARRRPPHLLGLVRVARPAEGARARRTPAQGYRPLRAVVG